MMKFIPMRELGYRFDEAGNVTHLNVGFEKYDDQNSLNSRLSITIEDITAINPAWNFDNLNKDRAELVARRKLRDWVMKEKEEPTPEEPPAE